MEGFRMLPFVLGAAVSLADLASPVTQAEYALVMVQQVVWHEPLSEEVRDYYLEKGRILTGFLHEGMTEYEVHKVLGLRPSDWVRAQGTWEDYYALLGLVVRYGIAGEGRLELVVEKVVVEDDPP
jgi:hypothetical protein